MGVCSSKLQLVQHWCSGLSWVLGSGEPQASGEGILLALDSAGGGWALQETVQTTGLGCLSAGACRVPRLNFLVACDGHLPPILEMESPGVDGLCSGRHAVCPAGNRNFDGHPWSAMWWGGVDRRAGQPACHAAGGPLPWPPPLQPGNPPRTQPRTGTPNHAQAHHPNQHTTHAPGSTRSLVGAAAPGSQTVAVSGSSASWEMRTTSLNGFLLGSSAPERGSRAP